MGDRWSYGQGVSKGGSDHGSAGYSTSGVAGRDTGAGFSGSGSGWGGTGSFGGFGGFGKGWGAGGNTSATQGKGGLYDEGGMVNFARGGKVAKRNEPNWADLKKKAGKPGFRETVAREERSQNERMTSAGNTARDRAARQMNVRSRDVSSTAWREPYLRPAAAPGPAAARPTAAPAHRIPTPTPRPPVSGGQPDESGQMPQVDTMGNPVGANYPQGYDTPGEVTDAIKQDPGWAHVQQKQQEMRDAQPPYVPPAAPWKRPPTPAPITPDNTQPTIDVPLIDPATGEPLVTQPAMRRGGLVYARGGAIPDDERPMTSRAESASYQSGRPRRKKRTDPWEG